MRNDYIPFALLASEAQFMTDCDIEDIIEDFEKQKSRRKPVEPCNN